MDALRALVADETDHAIELRRAIHRHPELGWHEFRTTQAVAAALEAVGLKPRIRIGSAGLVCDVGEGQPRVAFRADLDALPIQEKGTAPYASEVPNTTHACGHDAHTAIGVGIARVMNRWDGFDGAVRFLFQPAEELIPGGAEAMVKEGEMEGIESILAFHVDPSIAPGTVGLRADAITGASDRLHVTLNGPGGHTSRPHQTVDLVSAAAKLVVDLPAHLARRTDPRRPVAIVFGRIVGGSAENVIPTSVELGGTIRLFDLDLWRTLPPIVESLIHDIVSPLGATAKVEYEQGSPPVVNDERVIGVVRCAATSVLGSDSVLSTEQSLGSEDFSWFLQDAPGALVRLGARLPDRQVDLHAADFEVDERCIPTGIHVGAATLAQLLVG